MQVTISIRRTVIVDDNVNSFNINATTENISGNEDALLESFESRIAADSRRKINEIKIFDKRVRTFLLAEAPSGY